MADEAASAHLQGLIKHIKVEELVNSAGLAHTWILIQVVQVCEGELNLFTLLNFSVELDKIARGLAKHDRILPLKGHIRRSATPEDCEARVGLVACTTAAATSLVYVRKELLREHGFEARQNMMVLVHSCENLTMHLIHHELVLIGDPVAYHGLSDALSNEFCYSERCCLIVDDLTLVSFPLYGIELTSHATIS